MYVGAENICLSLFHIFIYSMILSKLGSNFRVTTPQQKNSENSGKYLKAAGSTHTVFTIGSVARADATVYMSGFWAR